MHRAILALLGFAAPLHAQHADPVHSPELVSFEYGILCFYSNESPDTPLTEAEADVIWADDSIDFELIRATNTLDVPGIEGLTFGVLSSFPDGVSNDAVNTLTRTAPDGTVIVEEFGITIDSRISIDAWYLDTDDGPLPGSYRFQTRRDADLFYDVTFQVIAPDLYTGELPDCVPAE